MGEKGERYYLSPYLSLLIIVPDDGKYKMEQLLSMVREVNFEFVPQDEFLSNRVYYYDRNQQKIM